MPSAMIRSIHQSLIRRQQAAAVQDPSSADDISPDSEQRITRFEELGSRNIIHRNVVDTITGNMGLDAMTEVQTATINEAIKGTDIVAQARTGTGKTIAFLLPILQRMINVDPHLAERSSGRRGPRTTADDIRGLIISPTRELAEQIAEEAKRLTRNTGIIVQTAVGGTHKRAGLRAIQERGCHLLVGTPGRLKDILSDPYTRVEAPDLAALVLDEADRLLDQGFWPEIQEIMRLIPTTQEKDRQTLMFSATVPREVIQLVRSTLKPGFQFVKCVRDDEQATHERVEQKVVRIKGMENALPTLIELCQRGIQAANEPDGKPFKAIVYFNSTAEVTLAASTLSGLELPAIAEQPTQDTFGSRSRRFGGAHPFGRARVHEIHSKLTQMQRTRTAQDFRNCQSGILLSSDVTARGMDFPNVTHVIQMGLPTSQEQYVHRVGRTARAGKEGEAWLLVNNLEVDEARSRLRDFPLQKDETLAIPRLDLTRPGDVPAMAGKILSMYQQSIQSVPMAQKGAAYMSQLGIYQWLSNKTSLIRAMNNLSQFGWGLREPPSMSPMMATRLGLRRIEGVRIGSSGGALDGRDDRGAERRDSFSDRRGGNSRDSFADRDLRRGRDRFSDSRGRGGRDGYGGGRSSSQSSGRRYGGPPRDQAFGNKPVYNDPFA